MKVGLGLRTGTSKPSLSKAVPIGTLFSQNNWPDLSHWVQVGPTGFGTGSDYAASSGKMLTYHGRNNLDDLFYYDNYYSRLDELTVVASCSFINSPSTDSYGTGIGFGDPTGRRCNITVDCTIANQGVCSLYGFDSSNAKVLLASSGGNTVLINDVFIFTLDINKFTVTATVRNVDRGWSTTVSYTMTNTYGDGSYGFKSSGRFFVNQLGRAFLWTSFSPSSNAYKNADLLIIGNSKAVGYYATTLADRLFTKMNTDLGNKMTLLAGGGDDVSDEMTFGINEFTNLTPQKVIFVSVADNDIRHGYSSGTWQAAYAALVAVCNSAGIPHRHCTLPENSSGGTDCTAAETYITGQGWPRINTWGVLGGFNHGSAYVVADGIHQNKAGQAVGATTIEAHL